MQRKLDDIFAPATPDVNSNYTQSKSAFLEHLTSLACEGETPLVVLQKPRREGNGYTWPAFLPSRWRNNGKAWYINTASFIIERFKDGKPSAAAANATHCLFLVLDDVGQPEKAPKASPLPPSWIMRTSPGSAQWGYIFSEQPTTGEFAAAIKAIALAGYSDPAALNPVRNVRLPGSVNLKPGRDNFAAVLEEFHPEREYTLDEICIALGVVPGEADSAAPAAVRLADDGNDEVLKWLSAEGLVLSGINGSGWCAVHCPRADEHTDGSPESRYSPATRSWCCLHTHGAELDSAYFLDWVAEHGGPANIQPGLRSDLLARTMARVLERLTPTPEYPDDLAEVLAEVEARQLGRDTKEQLHDRFAYVEPDDCYFDTHTRVDVSRRAFNAIYAHLNCKSNGRRVTPAAWFDENRHARGGKVLKGVTYSAGEGVLCVNAAGIFGNRWQNARPEIPQSAAAGDVGLWLDHCRRLIPDPAELSHVWNLMAFKLQYPREKINHALLFAGPTRCGKDTMFAPWFWALRGNTDRNIALVSAESLNQQWGYDLLSEVIIINELRQSDAHDRRALENKLKPIIAAPPEYLPVQRKGMHPVNVSNRVFVMAFSNFRDAIALPSDDGRWFVVWADCERMTPEQAIPIWTWYKTGGGFEAVAAWLLARDVSKFNPAGHPPWTEAKAVLCEQSLNSAEAYLLDAIEKSPEFAAGAICGPFHALLDRLQGVAPTGLKLYSSALFHALGEAGWKDMGRIMSADFRVKRRIFRSPALAHLSASDLRRLVEEKPPPVLTLVPK